MCADVRTPLTADRPFSPGDLARWCGGVWENPPGRIDGVMNDSRAIRKGNLYVALPGATVDGHAFVAPSIQAGAGGALVRDDWRPDAGLGPLPLLRVKDTLQALQALGSGYRRALAPFVVGVTGSVGKSTVKTWTAALLAAHAPTASTCGNFNTDIGLPLSLLQMAPQTRLGVFEMGMSHPGEIQPLCRVLEPDAAIITTIGPVHLEYFESVAAIACEKAEALRWIPAAGFAVLDAGSPWFAYLRGQTRARLVTVSHTDVPADYHATAMDDLAGSFTLTGPAVDHPRRLETGVPGRHNMLNVLLAIAAARNCGVPWEVIEATLPQMPRMSMRWEQSEWNGVTLINDAYNANPLAMESAIQTLTAVAKGHRRVLVLGEMRELGKTSEAFHADCGSCVAASGCDALIAVGQAGRWIADAAVKQGFHGSVICVGAAREAGDALAEIARAGDWVLLKASRGVALEQALAQWRSHGPAAAKTAGMSVP
jgi:UDP-N-acetylmuramoyl-tripeptide--D-alanyl-D-alanine ligase